MINRFRRYGRILVFLGGCGLNVSQAAQQPTSINIVKGKTVSGSTAAGGKIAPVQSSNRSGNGPRFPIIPAGSSLGNVSTPRFRQLNTVVKVSVASKNAIGASPAAHKTGGGDAANATAHNRINVKRKQNLKVRHSTSK